MEIKRFLGLDLGTNSIGWALVEQNVNDNTRKILGAGSRIIPMSQDILGKFDSGVSISQTAERTGFRGVRRLRERQLLRRERLHRVLNILGFLPQHYAEQIDFNRHFGQFLPETEPKINFVFNHDTGKADFLFKKTFEEMLADFAKHQPQLLENSRKIPYDWSIYYLRKKALRHKIEKEELAWLLLHFNQKRGYYQLRGEEEEDMPNKLVEFYSLKVVDIMDSGDRKGKDEIWYNVHLENGWIYRRTSKTPLDWIGKTKEFIVTTDLNDDGTIKKDKEEKEKRSFRAPAENDWTLVKKKTEHDIEKTKTTVGEYIYDNLLKNPSQKIKGKLVRTIERKFYKEELMQILQKQQEEHPELRNRNLYQACIDELYQYNETHRNSIGQKDFLHLFLNDILFYQRPLKSKKSLIGDCKFEKRYYKDKDGVKQTQALKGIAISHPLFQEFRLWKFINDLRIIQKEKITNGGLQTDVDVTDEFIKSKDDKVELFNWLKEKKEIEQKEFLKYPGFNLKKNTDNFRWKYVEDRKYPCNETRALIQSRLSKVKDVPVGFLNSETEEYLWHILYSIEDKTDLEKALRTFATKKSIGDDFVEQFKKFPPFKKDYGAYSAKALKKLLPLVRMGSYWQEKNIHIQTKERIDKIITGEYDEKIKDRVRDKAIHLTEISHFQGLPEWLASYIIYDRHSEAGETIKWKTPENIDHFLKNEFKQHDLRNPIVEQVIIETLRVLKDIWVTYGKGVLGFFDEIHIELGREMKNTKADREKMTKQLSENENTNLRIRALLMEFINPEYKIDGVRPYSPYQHEILKIYEDGILNTYEVVPDYILDIQKKFRESDAKKQPTKADINRYKLWLEQGYCSPYTGELIPLSKLFTAAYQIEHIIPQSRYFDDSFSNKVICEAVVNGEYYKGKQTGREFIKNFKGTIVPELSTPNKAVRIFTEEEYEAHVKKYFAKSRGKMKKLLMEDIPDSFIQRQLNDSRYISKVIKNLISNIVREDDEQETVSKNVISSNGAITSTLKQDWGLNDIWNEIITPRFERLNNLTNSKNFGEWTKKEGKRVFQTQVPLELQKGFSKKRIDHRHHALDAVIIACASRDHINYLNNESALGKKSKEEKDRKRYDLRSKLCYKKYNDESKENYKWFFYKPWDTFTQDTKEVLNSIVISFKQNQRVINKNVNKYQKWQQASDGEIIKLPVRQVKGENWAVRKPIHKDTVSGLVKLKLKKTVPLSAALNDWHMIVDASLKKLVKELVEKSFNKKQLSVFFDERGKKWEGNDISKVEIYYWDVNKEGLGNNAASRVKVNEIFDSSFIKFITDTGIQKIMLSHLERYNEEKDNKIIEHPELAFSPDGLDKLNANIKELNDGKRHQPIYKVRTYEPKGNKFSVGRTGNKKDKYVEAAKGTNLFFAIYQNQSGSRSYDTIPLNIAVERQKQKLSSVPEKDEAGNSLLMYLSPNDLVYIPSDEEKENIDSINFSNLNKAQVNNIYKMVSSSGIQCFFIQQSVANSIVNKFEFSPLNKTEKSIEGIMIKERCIKLKVDRLGNIKPAM